MWQSCVCVCVKRLYRRKTSMALLNLVFWYYFSFQTSRGMECASDVSIQRRRICCTVIWIGDAQSTYLHLFSGMGRGSTQEPPCRLIVNADSLHCCRNLALFYFILDFTASEPSSEQGRRKFTSHWNSRWINQFSWQFFKGLFCARVMHSTTTFAMLFLSKCVWVCVKLLYVKLCVVCVCVCVRVCECVEAGGGRRRREEEEAEETRDTESKTRTPHKVVGK